MMNSVQKQLNDVTSQLFHLFHLKSYLVDRKRQLVHSFANQAWNHPFVSDSYSFFHPLLAHADNAQMPYISENNYMERFIIVPYYEKGPSQTYTNQYFIAGPLLFRAMSVEQLKRMLYDLNMIQALPICQLFYESIPLISAVKSIHISKLIYFLLYNIMIDSHQIQQYMMSQQQIEEVTQLAEVELSTRREQLRFHHNYAQEKIWLNIIRNGNIKALDGFANLSSEEMEAGLLARNSALRNEKNLSISGITLMTRAAIEGGLLPEIAYALSDLYIQQLEELPERNAVIHLRKKAMHDFTSRVEQIKFQQYSPKVNQCIRYIDNHIYEPITLATLAQLVHLNGSYLSHIFKRDTGFSLQAFIQKRKIEEAKQLIQYSSYSLAEIGSLLQFSDQSYFTKVFKKYTKITPSQYEIMLANQSLL